MLLLHCITLHVYQIHACITASCFKENHNLTRRCKLIYIYVNGFSYVRVINGCLVRRFAVDWSVYCRINIPECKNRSLQTIFQDHRKAHQSTWEDTDFNLPRNFHFNDLSIDCFFTPLNTTMICISFSLMIMPFSLLFYMDSSLFSFKDSAINTLTPKR